MEDLGLRGSVLAIKDNERLHVRRKEINPINRPKRYELQTICENNKMDPAFVASAVQILTACKLLNTVPPFDVSLKQENNSFCNNYYIFIKIYSFIFSIMHFML